MDNNKKLEDYILNSDLNDAETQENLVHIAREQLFAFHKLMAYYRCAIMEIETKFNVINEEFSVLYERNPIENIKSRLKEPSSIIDKLDRKGFPLSVESIEKNLFDVAGVRVVCSFVDDVYRVAEALIRQDDITLIERKDYIAQPKENGYRSLHLIVSVPIFLTSEKRMMNVEIQLRTIAMDFWASLEHQLHYKKDYLFTPKMADDLKICADVSTELDKLMNNLCQQIHAEDGC
ncbi:MAG: GTP pyrophosphokinase family protein [Peptococcaceae bacterium]|nr:GTP pyrophosphokinase family protein [Peptococcaceae bacterium]